VQLQAQCVGVAGLTGLGRRADAIAAAADAAEASIVAGVIYGPTTDNSDAFLPHVNIPHGSLHVHSLHEYNRL